MSYLTGSIVNITHVTTLYVQLSDLNFTLSEQKEVEISYHCPMIYYKLNSDSGCFIDNINVSK